MMFAIIFSMKILIIYDSLFGNTELVAKQIQKTLSTKHTVQIYRMQDFVKNDVSKYDMVVLGTPTHGGRPTEAITSLIESIECHNPKTVFLCFDTRMAKDKHGLFIKMLLSIIDFASPKMVHMLKNKGFNTSIPEGFFVESKNGPLAPGEIERAKKWILGEVSQYE